MGTREDELKRRIEQSFGSIKKFSDASGIPKSTIYNILDRGIENTRTKTMELVYAHIKLDESPSDEDVSEDERELLDLFKKMSTEQRAAILEIARTMNK